MKIFLQTPNFHVKLRIRPKHADVSPHNWAAKMVALFALMLKIPKMPKISVLIYDNFWPKNGHFEKM